MSGVKTKKPRWLIIVPALPRPDRAGGDRRLVEILKSLGKHCELFLVALASGWEHDVPYRRDLRGIGVRVLGYGVRAGVQALVRFSFDAVFFEFYHTTEPLLGVVRRLQPHALVIVDSVDVHFLREREAARLGTHEPSAAERTELHELNAYRSADVTVVVSHSERAALAQAGVRALQVIPIIVTVTQREVRARKPELLFVGGFNHPPNRLAVEWFHRDIWPLVKQRVPAAGWVIAGSNTPPSIHALNECDGISVLGLVPSTDPLLDSAEISIAPLTYGGGMKVKVCEALAAGVPVVTTKWGAQGLEEGQNSAFRVADDPSEFADAVVALLNDASARSRLSEEGQRLAARLCTMDAAAGPLAELRLQSAGRRGQAWPVSRTRAFARYALGRVVHRLGLRAPSR